ncbi:MAG: lipoprotein [Succinivibrio sp.]
MNYLVRYLLLGFTVFFLSSCGIKGPLYFEESQEEPQSVQNSEQQPSAQEQNQ